MDVFPRNEGSLLDPYMFFRGTPELLRTLQGPRRSRRCTCRALSTLAASSCLLAVSAQSGSPPRPRVCGVARSTRLGVGTPPQSIIFALPLPQTERRCRECHPAPIEPAEVLRAIDADVVRSRVLNAGPTPCAAPGRRWRAFAPADGPARSDTCGPDSDVRRRASRRCR